MAIYWSKEIIKLAFKWLSYVCFGYIILNISYHHANALWEKTVFWNTVGTELNPGFSKIIKESEIIHN